MDYVSGKQKIQKLQVYRFLLHQYFKKTKMHNEDVRHKIILSQIIKSPISRTQKQEYKSINHNSFPVVHTFCLTHYTI